MRFFWVTVLICLFTFQSPSHAIFQKKNYKQNFLNNAYNAEKRHDDNSAFHSYEKAIYYYPKDKKVIEAYAKFCERQKYFDKAIKLYTKLYVMTKDEKYKFKVEIYEIKNGNLTSTQIEKKINPKTLNHEQKKELNKALIYHFTYKRDWAKVKTTCDKLDLKDIGLDIIQNCIISNEKVGDKKKILKYQIRNYELSPNDIDLINKVISISESQNDLKSAEQFVKKLLALNPNNNGIKYKLAGIYERQNNWLKASKVYEGLMISGDKSEHVTRSYDYVLSQLNPPKKSADSKPTEKNKIYPPKALSKFKQAEKNFYTAWKMKDYDSAQNHLNTMLAEQPNNKKLLQHKVDIDVSQNDFAKAILTFEKINTNSTKDNKFLAFLYAKNQNNTKALEIIEKTMGNNPKDNELPRLALQYSLAEKNWDSAIKYNKILLELEPKSEKLLKSAGDLYSIKQDFPNSITYYEKLTDNYPKTEYEQELANLYMANQEFSNAERLLEPLYEKFPENKKITDLYLNSLLAQRKTKEAYWVIKEKRLEQTPEGYMVFGDLAMESKHFDMAGDYYFKAVELRSESTILKNKLADSYRLSGFKTGAAKIYNEVLAQDPKNLGARLGIGSLEIDKKNFTNARSIFYDILKDKADYRPAKVAIAHSYIANDEKLAALEQLDSLNDDDETKFMKAQVYYNMEMRTDSKSNLKNSETEDAKELRYKIKKDDAITVIPVYTGFYQTLANEFRLNYQKYGLQVSKNINNNANVFMEYNVYWYTSGPTSFLSNVTNEFKGGIQQRPNEKWEYRADLGVKAFQSQGGMLLTNSWLKYYFNDWFNLKLGFYRNNLEQSYTSAVGQYIDGIYTGQVAENKVYLEYEAKLPKQFYSFGRGAYGLMTAQNMPTNQFFEGYIGVGKAFYNNMKNPWINRLAFDIVSYNSAYQYNLLNLYNSAGQLFGGYFSPSYFNATTGNLKLEGYIKKLRLHYGIKAFGGIQTALSPDQQTPTYGYNPYLALDINDHITLNASYNHFTYADMQRDIFLFNLVIKGFRKDAKS